jgi:3-deoxy-D-manno-octulosonic-acid transferase
MIGIYRLLFFPIFVILLLKNLRKMLRRGGYGTDLRHRFGFFPRLPKTKKKRLWIQAVSVGEVNAIAQLVAVLGEHYEIVLTTTTSTARKMIVQKLAKSVLFYGYFPWDFWLFSWFAWRRICPDGAILVESELWPEHIWQAKRRKIPIFLVNARLSDRSFRRYQKFPRLAQWIFKKIDFIIASSEQNRERIATFCAKTVECFGSVKFDIPVQSLSQEMRKNLRKELGFSENSFVILGCSTWPGEEVMLLEAFRKIKARKNGHVSEDYNLLLIPRHVERRGELVSWLQNENISFWQRSKGITAGKFDVCLGDTTGELAHLVQIADLAYIGKSLAPHTGGQSPLDTAMAGVPTIYGNRMTNFYDICTQLERENAAIKVENERNAIDTITELVTDAKRLQLLSNNIRSWFKKNQGASVKVYDFIRERLDLLQK